MFRILPPRIHCSAFYHSGFATPCFTVPDLLFRISCSGVLCFTAALQSLLIKYSKNIKGHKGQNSIGARCCGSLVLDSWCRCFLVLESPCCGFLVLESRCRGFLSSEKTPWNHDAVAYLSPFLDVVVFWSWNLDVVVFWSWNLDVVAFWSWNLDVVVYVPPRPRFRYHRENKKITHNYVNYVVEKYFSCPNLCNIYLHNVCISELE